MNGFYFISVTNAQLDEREVQLWFEETGKKLGVNLDLSKRQ